MSINDAAPFLWGFLLTLSRVVGVFAFVPIPGTRSGPDAARILCALALTVALFPLWPSLPHGLTGGAAAAPEPSLGQLLTWAAAEAVFGITVGLAVAALLEAFQFAAQIIGLQAGYSYAGTVDPNSEADSSVLLVFAQLFGGCLFFALGLDREVVRALAWNLKTAPAGSFLSSPSIVGSVVRLSSEIFSVGLRLAMPEVALLLLIDLCFAAMGRLQPQIQFISLAFSAKMLAALALLGLSLAAFPAVTRTAAGHLLAALSQICGAR